MAATAIVAAGCSSTPAAAPSCAPAPAALLEEIGTTGPAAIAVLEDGPTLVVAGPDRAVWAVDDPTDPTLIVAVDQAAADTTRWPLADGTELVDVDAATTEAARACLP